MNWATAGMAAGVIGIGILAPGLGTARPSAPTQDPGFDPAARVSQAKQIKVGGSPTGIARARGRMYVAVLGTDSVAAIDIRSNKVVARYTGFPDAENVIATPDGKTVFVSVSSDFGVRAINTTTGKVRKYKSSGGSLVLSPDGKYLYASPGGGPIQRTNLRNRRVRDVPGSEGFSAQTISPHGKFLFAWTANIQPDNTAHPQLMKIRAESGRVVKQVDITEETLWMFAGDLLLGPKSKWLYVSKQCINDGWTGVSGHTVQRYRSSDLSEGKEYDVGFGDTNVELGPQGMAFSVKRWKTRLAVANSTTGKVAIVNLRTGKTKTRATGFAPTDVAFRKSGRKLFVTNTGFGGIYPNTVSVLRFG
ncbi:MAG: hypothetical protein U0990_07990 [Candidatus Nanopelagicales bacterium]|nr:hypothetical protein [Candidatus Nanopelagicales bacterium]MDZ4250015.1 hypothetical protein [Candidatus Nanopelagicales bacterium]